MLSKMLLSTPPEAKIALRSGRNPWSRPPASDDPAETPPCFNIPYSVLAKDRESVKRIRWRDVEMGENPYSIQVFPTNLLASQPAARWEQVQEMLQAGFLGREAADARIDFPDIKAATSRRNAAYNVIRQSLESMADGGDYVSPEPFDNLTLAVKEGQAFYNLLRLKKVPDARLGMIRQYIDDAQAMLEPPPAPGPIGEPSLPMGPTPPMPMGPPDVTVNNDISMPPGMALPPVGTIN